MSNPDLISRSEALELRQQVFGDGDEARYAEATTEYRAAARAVEELNDIKNVNGDYDAAIMLAQRRSVVESRKVKRDALVMALAIGEILGFDKKQVISELEITEG